MQFGNGTIAPANSYEKTVMILCGCTSGLGIISLAITLVQFVLVISKRREVVGEQIRMMFKPSVWAGVISLVKTIISIILTLFELFFTSLTFFSGLQSYDTLLLLTKESSTGVPGINTWLRTGKAPGYPTVTSLDGRIALYFSIATVILLAFTMIAPFLLTYAFILKDGSEIPLVENKVLNTIWSLIKKAVGWVIVRVLVFALNYNAKYLLVIFIIIPWSYANHPLYVIWALALSLIAISAFTVQGFWAAVVRSVKSIKSDDRLVDALNDIRSRALLVVLITGIKPMLAILIMAIVYLLLLILKVLLGFPEPIGIRMVPPCFFCRKGKELSPCAAILMLLVPQFVVNDEIISEFHDEKHPAPTIIEWTRFTTAYTLSFIMLIPWAGPYLFLLGNMLSRTGFWFAPFFLFTERIVSGDGQVEYVNRETENFDKNYTPEKGNIFLNFLHKWFWPIRDSDYHRMVDYARDNDRLLRCMLMVLIPMIAIIPIFVPATRSGFSSTELLEFIFYGRRWQ